MLNAFRGILAAANYSCKNKKEETKEAATPCNGGRHIRSRKQCKPTHARCGRAQCSELASRAAFGEINDYNTAIKMQAAVVQRGWAYRNYNLASK